MIYHTRLVTGARTCTVVADMPFMSYHLSPQQASERRPARAGRQRPRGEAGRRPPQRGRDQAIVGAEIP